MIFQNGTSKQETRELNQTEKRNIEQFSGRFFVQLTPKICGVMPSQFVMTSRRKRSKSSVRLAFTEHGIAINKNIILQIVGIFIKAKTPTINKYDC
ncbi:MAG: ORF6N domain-containing protein [Prevotellaceae bacterium]|nr:ORF6N domain-containing protein [Prevotellaceae bacterium]